MQGPISSFATMPLIIAVPSANADTMPSATNIHMNVDKNPGSLRPAGWKRSSDWPSQSNRTIEPDVMMTNVKP